MESNLFSENVTKFIHCGKRTVKSGISSCTDLAGYNNLMYGSITASDFNPSSDSPFFSNALNLFKQISLSGFNG